MKNLIVANWKMNPNSQKEAKEIFDAIREGVRGMESEVVVCPPSVYLYASGFGEGVVAMGAQNVYFEDKGAFTGEISVGMLNDLGVKYVIIGHSERRKYFGDTDEIVNKKVKKALEADLKVIFCIGETTEERDAGKKNEVLEKQIKIGLDGISNLKFQTSNLSVAYEPVWAIGTGNNCGVEETKDSVEFIRKTSGAERILYGGSVKSDNSGDYIKIAGANGLLVGGASLKAEEFIKIVKSAE
ncbi:MAG: triose-phosphate isomerase [Candidatus Staskawiczbacteria bacterium]|nr:triose-phosphate isomerase [Candidatus Staskawiczbacteria bacterium]